MTGEVIHEESSLHREDGNRREEEKWERICEELPTVGLGRAHHTFLTTHSAPPFSDSISIRLTNKAGPVIYRTFPACCRFNDGFEVSPVF